MANQHLQRSATTGHLIKTNTGHLAKKCSGCPCTSVDSCTYCDSTPDSFVVSFSNVSMKTDCLACTETGSLKVTGGGSVSGGVFSGTFTLTQDPLDACVWRYDTSTSLPITVTWWLNNDCTGSTWDADQFHISLSKLDATTFRLEVSCEYVQCYAYVYKDTFTVAANSCCADYTSSNEYTHYCTLHCATNAVGQGGTATITACAP